MELARKLRGPVLLAAALAVAVTLAAGCAGRTPVRAPSAAREPLPASVPPPYLLQLGDLLEIKFWGNEELDLTVRVRPDGKISLPFIDEVTAAGLTPAELDDALTASYASELARPDVTVIVAEAGGQRVFVGGEVRVNRAIPLQGRLTVLQAIQEAGGFLTTARRRQVLLIRTAADGSRLARAIDTRPILSGAAPQDDLVLRPADVVYVPRTKIANVGLFVDQYVNSILPVQSLGTALAIEAIRDNGNNNQNTAGDGAAPPGGTGAGAPPG